MGQQDGSWRPTCSLSAAHTQHTHGAQIDFGSETRGKFKGPSRRRNVGTAGRETVVGYCLPRLASVTDASEAKRGALLLGAYLRPATSVLYISYLAAAPILIISLHRRPGRRRRAAVPLNHLSLLLS